LTPDLAYLVFGLVLVAALVAITAFYYSRKRKSHVEQAKYKMLEDDE
jgi:LPXTG-motif cell wall-anchored protein